MEVWKVYVYDENEMKSERRIRREDSEETSVIISTTIMILLHNKTATNDVWAEKDILEHLPSREKKTKKLVQNANC